MQWLLEATCAECMTADTYDFDGGYDDHKYKYKCNGYWKLPVLGAWQLIIMILMVVMMIISINTNAIDIGSYLC